jgi:23S rRNA (adenine2503-C2)-methyltransferase
MLPHETATGAVPVPLGDFELTELESFVTSLGYQPFHARQLFGWLYRRGVTAPEGMTDLPQALRQVLANTTTSAPPTVTRRDVSSDGTTKYLLRLADGRFIEAVYIPDTPNQTFCLSTQVGCAMGCAFCLTGRMGIVRNLSPAEIVGQVQVLAADQRLLDATFNIVLMGMGEPLHNYEATMKALRILGTKEGLALPARRMTLSTVGVLPALERLATEPVMPNLAVSLHGTTDQQRSALIPVNRKYGLTELLDACRRFPVKRRARITFEYVLLREVNDTLADARRLGALLRGLRAKVNLLPLNEAPGIPFARPNDDRVSQFARTLAGQGMTVTVRKSRGRDIRAACGQLIVEGKHASPGQQMAAMI